MEIRTSTLTINKIYIVKKLKIPVSGMLNTVNDYKVISLSVIIISQWELLI